MEVLFYLAIGAVIVIVIALCFGLSVGLKTWAILCWLDAFVALLLRVLVDYGESQGIYAPIELRAHASLIPLYIALDLVFGCFLWWLAVKLQRRRRPIG